MRKIASLLLLSVATLTFMNSQAGAVTVQGPGDVFNGRSYLWLEAESFSSLGEDLDDNGWKIVSKESPITSTQGLDILPATSNVSGTALLDDSGGGQHADTAVYEVQFMTAGTYQFYTRNTMFDENGNGSFSNEDSIFVSPAFDMNSSSDWVGFNGLIFDENDVTVDIPTPGFALDPDGFKPGVGDTENEGWHAIRDWRIKSQGVILGTSSQDPSLQNGNFNWYNRPAYVSSGAGGGFDSDYGFKTEFIVTPGQVGQTVTFEIGTREHYGVIDGFLFIQDDDVDLLDVFTQAEVDAILITLGDFDGDGDADGADFLLWQQGGSPNPLSASDLADWETGFGASNALASLRAVPEPTSLMLITMGGFALLARRRQF